MGSRDVDTPPLCECRRPAVRCSVRLERFRAWDGVLVAKFKINEDVSGVSYRKTVEASKYRQDGEYFHFTNSVDVRVYSVAAKHVVTIEREDDAK